MSDRFENIKDGDIVYVRKSVSYGFNSYRYFSIPITVIKTTKTQFICANNKRYAKCHGREIGGGYNDVAMPVSGSVFDESELMIDFKKKTSAILKATNIIYELDRIRNKIHPDIDTDIVKDFIISADKFLAKAKGLIG